ncbi:hypothetical protein QAD02_010153 [Eretmocerus hayati]|uniref:Uncharacterized protein n=1 Tax=Eretmocerus hayati TaxID=131215 RepID=A0ACC2NFX8_9HYME|nr:hypothetical protein QAD02_010153 [Eretmocerus hayati]
MNFVGFLLLIVYASAQHLKDKHSSEELRKTLVSADDSYSIQTDIAEDLSYVAQLLNPLGFLGCLAVILSEDWLITAAHCVHERDKEMMKIVTGTTIRGFNGPISSIEKIVYHEYDPCTKENDIALIKLKQSIEINDKQRPIPIAKRPPAISDKMIVTKLDQNSNNHISKLKSEEELIKQLPQCQRDMGNKKCGLKESHSSCLIIGQTFDHATLQHGDSGGPAVINDQLVGIIRSRRYNRNKTRFTNVYINVYEYRNWIHETTGISCSNSVYLGCSLMK